MSNGPQPPGELDLHRARERALEVGQADGTSAEVAQAQRPADRSGIQRGRPPALGARPGIPGRSYRQL